MAKVNPGKDQIVRTAPPASTQLPAHLQNRKPMGIDELKDYIILPKLKVMQKSSDAEQMRAAGYKVGDLLALPTRTRLRSVIEVPNAAPVGERFIFTPVFFYPSWAVLNDIKSKGNGPTYLKYTIDKNDPLVSLCRNPATREQVHPNNPTWKVRNVEQLNFVILMEDVGDLSLMPIIMTCMSGEHRSGTDFNSRIRMMKADIFARRWVGRTKFRPSRGQGDWYGIEIQRVEDALLEEDFASSWGNRSPWATAEEITKLEEIHLEIASQFKQSGIKGVEDAEEAVVASGDDPAASPAGNKY